MRSPAKDAFLARSLHFSVVQMRMGLWPLTVLILRFRFVADPRPHQHGGKNLDTKLWERFKRSVRVRQELSSTCLIQTSRLGLAARPFTFW